MKNRTKTLSDNGRTFTPRIRFNWGFHDGAADQRRGFVALWNRGAVVHHHDGTYLAGYRAGQDAVKAGLSTESSDAAWAAHVKGGR
jgi:hypothetical protein